MSRINFKKVFKESFDPRSLNRILSQYQDVERILPPEGQEYVSRLKSALGHAGQTSNLSAKDISKLFSSPSSVSNVAEPAADYGTQEPTSKSSDFSLPSLAKLAQAELEPQQNVRPTTIEPPEKNPLGLPTMAMPDEEPFGGDASPLSQASDDDLDQALSALTSPSPKKFDVPSVSPKPEKNPVKLDKPAFSSQGTSPSLSQIAKTALEPEKVPEPAPNQNPLNMPNLKAPDNVPAGVPPEPEKGPVYFDPKKFPDAAKAGLPTANPSPQEPPAPTNANPGLSAAQRYLSGQEQPLSFDPNYLKNLQNPTNQRSFVPSLKNLFRK